MGVGSINSSNRDIKIDTPSLMGKYTLTIAFESNKGLEVLQMVGYTNGIYGSSTFQNVYRISQVVYVTCRGPIYDSPEKVRTGVNVYWLEKTIGSLRFATIHPDNRERQILDSLTRAIYDKINDTTYGNRNIRNKSLSAFYGYAQSVFAVLANLFGIGITTESLSNLRNFMIRNFITVDLIRNDRGAGLHNRPGPRGSQNPLQYITIHNTGESGNGVDAKRFADYVKGDECGWGLREVSSSFQVKTIADQRIVQIGNQVAAPGQNVVLTVTCNGAITDRSPRIYRNGTLIVNNAVMTNSLSNSNTTCTITYTIPGNLTEYSSIRFAFLFTRNLNCTAYTLKFNGVTIVNTIPQQVNLNAHPPKSWHYTVDERIIYQHLPDNEIAYHASYSVGNNRSIGIEICMNNDGDLKGATNNAAWLAAGLCGSYYISPTSEYIKTHRHWILLYDKNSDKICPKKMLVDKQPYTWDNFIEEASDSKNGLQTGQVDSSVTAHLVRTAKNVSDWRENTLKTLK